MILEKGINKLKVLRKNMLLKIKNKDSKAYYLCTGTDTVILGETGIISNIATNKQKILIGSEVLIDGIIASFSGRGTIEIGDFSYVGPNTRVWAYERVTIGKHVLISHNCNILDSNCHPIDALERRKDYDNLLHHGGGNQHGEVICAPIEIGNDAWIGANVCVMKGVSIGERTIVAAGSVVTKSFPADVVVAGNPAHIVKYLVEKK